MGGVPRPASSIGRSRSLGIGGGECKRPASTAHGRSPSSQRSRRVSDPSENSKNPGHARAPLGSFFSAFLEWTKPWRGVARTREPCACERRTHARRRARAVEMGEGLVCRILETVGKQNSTSLTECIQKTLGFRTSNTGSSTRGEGRVPIKQRVCVKLAWTSLEKPNLSSMITKRHLAYGLVRCLQLRRPCPRLGHSLFFALLGSSFRLSTTISTLLLKYILCLPFSSLFFCLFFIFPSHRLYPVLFLFIYFPRFFSAYSASFVMLH